FPSRRRDTRFSRDWSSDVCSSDLPARELAGTELAPPQEGREGDAGEGVHAFEEIDHRVAFVGGSPGVLQSSPSSFFVRTSSSVTAAMTSSFLLRRASSCSILRSPGSGLRERDDRSKAAAPFSKKVLCHW